MSPFQPESQGRNDDTVPAVVWNAALGIIHAGGPRVLPHAPLLLARLEEIGAPPVAATGYPAVR